MLYLNGFPANIIMVVLSLTVTCLNMALAGFLSTRIPTPCLCFSPQEYTNSYMSSLFGIPLSVHHTLIKPMTLMLSHFISHTTFSIFPL